MNKAIFIDKDGTLVEDVPYNVNPDLIRFTKGAVSALRKLKKNGYLLILISNQAGIAHGYFRYADLMHLRNALDEMLRSRGVSMDGFFFCPHHPRGKIKAYAKSCTCRKPKPGMILQAAEQFNIDLRASWMIGDILNDVEAGNTAGCKTILINNGNETEWIMDDKRKPTTVVANFTQAADAIVHQFEHA